MTQGRLQTRNSAAPKSLDSGAILLDASDPNYYSIPLNKFIGVSSQIEYGEVVPFGALVDAVTGFTSWRNSKLIGYSNDAAITVFPGYDYIGISIGAASVLGKLGVIANTTNIELLAFAAHCDHNWFKFTLHLCDVSNLQHESWGVNSSVSVAGLGAARYAYFARGTLPGTVKCVTRNAPATQTTDNVVCDSTSGYHRYEIKIKLGQTKYYIDGTSVATHTIAPANSHMSQYMYGESAGVGGTLGDIRCIYWQQCPGVPF